MRACTCVCARPLNGGVAAAQADEQFAEHARDKLYVRSRHVSWGTMESRAAGACAAAIGGAP
jgi:hypothetical protein